MRDIIVAEHEQNMRLDSLLASRFPEISRARVQRAINQGGAVVDGVAGKSSSRMAEGQRVSFQVPEPVRDAPMPEDIPLDILFEDQHLVAINKPAGMVVHPAKGHWSGTLTAALAFHFDKLSSVGGEHRPGIVHRLDRDTSGVIVVAKTDMAHAKLSQQFERRSVRKIYWAIVSPPPDRDRDEINQPIGVHPYQREKMAIRTDHPKAREATTFYEVLQRVGRFALLSVTPRTGRTHQIRVHLAHIGSPVLSDKLYSGRSFITQRDLLGHKASEEKILCRQALHSKSLQFDHPVSGESMLVEADPSDDLKSIWTAIEDSVK